MKWIVVLVLLGASTLCFGQRIPPPPQSFLNSLNNAQSQNQSIPGGGPGTINMQAIQQQQKTEELANIKDESIKRVLTELSTLQTPSQMSDTMSRVADLVGPLFVVNFDARKDELSKTPSDFPQRLLSAVTDIQGEEVKALVLQRKFDSLLASDFAFLPLAIQYGLQENVLASLSGTKLASLVKVNPGDTVVADKVATALVNKSEDQIEFLQSLGPKLLPQVQRIIMSRLVEWWKDPHNWKDRELNLLTTAGTPILAYMPQSQLQSLDDELADRFVTVLGQTPDIARGWWMKPMSLKKAWFDLAKGARYFGAVHEWSFRRMQKLSFLLEGASPEDLELVPPVPGIKSLVIGNHYTELQTRVVFDAFYRTPPLSQEDLQEFQFHVLDLIPTQLQRFDFADSFGTLDEMLSILDRQKDPSYPTVLQISYFMWPIVNTTNSITTIAPPSTWQKRELTQLGRMFFLLPKSVLSQINQGIINWDSNTLSAIRSNHLTHYQIWKLTSQILLTVDDRFKPDYIFMIPPPFQKGIPSYNISQALLGSSSVRPEVLRALIEQTSDMLISQKAVILQRISNRIAEPIVIRTMISTSNPAEMFKLISPKNLSKNMGTIIKTILEMPETGRFGITSIQAKLLPQNLLSLWLKWVRENAQVSRWTAEDLLGRSPMGATNELNLAILGLSCRDVEIIDPWDILSVTMHYRHELYALRRFKSSLKFNVNLRSCMLEKVIEYLQQKKFLDGNQTDTHVFTGITVGETEAVGGEILSVIPTTIMEQLDLEARVNIIKEIGQLQMQEMFSLSSLETLHWYGQTLFRDIVISSSHGIDNSSDRKRRQTSGENTPSAVDSTSSETASATPTDSMHTSDAAQATSGLESRATNDTPSPDKTDPSTILTNSTEMSPSAPSSPPLPKHEIDLEALNSLGNLLCYADNVFDANWPRSLLKDVLEAKTSIGEKTCCFPQSIRNKWFEALKAVYGSDTSSWNEVDLTSIGDLLIVLPDKDLQKISTDTLGKAVTPMMRQSAWASKLTVPGEVKKIQFVMACTEALGTEGAQFMATYKALMKRIFQASQWMVNTVKTTQELIRDGVGRTGRIPRWAEHTLVKRQVPISAGEPSYSGSSPAGAPGSPTIYTQAPTGGYTVQTQGPQNAAPMNGNLPAQSQPVQQQQQQQGGSFSNQNQPTGGGSFSNQNQPTGGGNFGKQQTGGPALQQSTTGKTGVPNVNNPLTTTDVQDLQTRSLNEKQPQPPKIPGQQQQPGSNLPGVQQQQPGSSNLPGVQQQQPGSSNLPGVQQQQPGSNLQGVQQQPGGNLPGVQQQPGGNLPGVQQQPSGNLPGVQQQQQQQPGGNLPGVQQQQQQQPGGNLPGVQQQQQQQPGSNLVQQPGSNIPGVQQQQQQPGSKLPGTQQQQQQAGPSAGTFGSQQAGGATPKQVSTGKTGVPSNSVNNPLASKVQDVQTRSLNFGALQDETHNSEITCHGIKAAGSAAIGLSFDDLNKLSQADLFDCVEALGHIEWDEDTKGQIMTILKEKLEFNKDSINALTLIELGDIVTAFSADPDEFASNVTTNSTVHSDVSMIDLTLPTSLDVLSILGNQVTDSALLKSLAGKFNQDNRIFPGFSEGIARPENLRIVVMSLGNIMCGLNDKIVNSIFETDATLFIDTSRVLGQLEGCGNEVLSTLATHAVRPSNYGPPRLWGQEDVDTIGVVFAGLKPDIISTIPAEAMQGLTPMAVKSLPTSSMVAFRSDQLSKISYSAALAFTPSQTNNFSPAQAEALRSVLQVKPELFNVPTVVDSQPTVTPTQTTETPPGDEVFIARDVEDKEGPGIGGRSRDSPTHATVPEPTETTPDENTHIPPPFISDTDSETPSSSPSSTSRILSVWQISNLAILLAAVVPMIQCLNI